MKKRLLFLVFGCIVVAIGVIILNIEVTTKQGINYQWYTIKIPLYLKILDFYDRHYNYRHLVKRITKGSKDDNQRVLKIFKWTYQNIRKAPEGFPAIDDHVWHIIIRGYGVGDQYSDVFTTLCNYARMDAFYRWVYKPDQSARLPISFVRVEGKWTAFDPYYGVYFEDRKGNLADIELLGSNDWTVQSLAEAPPVDYADYLSNIAAKKDVGLHRGNIQSPLNRLLFELKKRR